MPPKKHQDKTQKLSQKCNFNNRGFCKSKTECKNKHSDVVCDNQKCEEENCDKDILFNVNMVYIVDFTRKTIVCMHMLL